MQEFIDVLNTGFGVSIIISFPYQERVITILLDSGDNNPEIYKDTRRVKIVNYLNARNIKHIDFSFLSHIHKDHIAGYTEILNEGITIGTFFSNMSVYPLSNALLEIGKYYNDLSTQYILYSLQEYLKIMDCLGDKTVTTIVDKELTISLGEYTLLITPIDQSLLFDIYQNLRKADNIELSIEERYHYLRLFDSQLNKTTLSVTLKKRNKILFYSPGELDLSNIENCYLNESVHILHCPHHGDSNFLGEETLSILDPQSIVVCADSEGTYHLPTPNFSTSVQKICSANICFTETKESQYQIIRFLIHNLNIETQYLLLSTVID